MISPKINIYKQDGNLIHSKYDFLSFLYIYSILIIQHT